METKTAAFLQIGACGCFFVIDSWILLFYGDLSSQSVHSHD
jgi:hypothetical protein